MKSNITAVIILICFFNCFFNKGQAQVTLLEEDFNDCNIPTGWSLDVSGAIDPTFYVGLPTNDDSDGSTIDGSCMLIIDDDATGNNTAPYVLQFISPVFDGTQYPVLELNLDVHFRAYQGSSLSIKVFDGTTEHLVRSWSDNDETGEQFSEFENVTLDLSFYASSTMQLIIEYDDNGIWAWWAGVDNIEITGKGSGSNVLLQDFNGCSLPAGWTSDIQLGDAAWQFGFIENSNSSATSMNGSCFAYFDDDGLGQNAAFSSALLRSPVFDGSSFANYTLSFDLIFRKYADLEQFAVWVWDGNETQLVQTFSEDYGGPQFDEYLPVEIDLSPFRSQQMAVVFSYFDGNAWGWWVGLDNVKITGNGSINDLCSNAFDLTTGTTCMASNNLTAIFDGDQPSCIGDNVASLWYRYQADFTGILKIETQAAFNDVVTVFNGTCTNASELVCGNRDEFGFTGETVYVEVSNGAEYLIRVSGVEVDFGLPRGALCIELEQVPAFPTLPDNDVCANAVSLNMDGECVSGNNFNASFEGPAPAHNLKSRADIWYSFIATTDGEIQVNTQADFADVITIFGGSCGSLVELASNEYGQVLKTSGLTVGETYYIQIAGFFATIEGGICIVVETVNENPASNDLCTAATNLIVGGGCVEGSNISATFDGPLPSCSIFGEANIWYQFVAPASGGVQLNTGADFVHDVAVYTGDCNSLQEFLCLNNPVRCDGYVQIGGLIAGETYFLQIAAAANPFGFLEGNVCVDLLDYNSTSGFEPLSLSINVNCIADGFGMITMEASGGVGAYTFEGNTEQDTLETGDEFLVVLSDENGCEVSRIGTVECGQIPCVLPTELSIINVSCFGGNNGQAFVEVVEGTEPYTYAWSNGASTALVNNLSPGDYSVTITDETGCPATLYFEITQPDILLANSSSTNETADGANDGTVTVDPGGGTAPYTYAWSNGSNEQSQLNLNPGIYEITITDANGCESIESVVVAPFGCTLLLDHVTEVISCFEANDGHIEIYPQSGTGPFIFAWNTGASTDVLSNLGPGTYTVTVTDATGCPAIENFTLVQPLDLAFSASEVLPALCFGTATGSATLNAQGGTSPYFFDWAEGADEAVRTDLIAGLYFVTVVDANGCTEVNSIEILEPQAVAPVSVNPQGVSCFGDSDGVGTVIVNGGTAPFTYQWDDPLSQTGSQANNLAPGTYNVDVVDANGCTGTTIVVIEEPGQLELTIDGVTDDVNNTGVGAIAVTILGGTLPYNFNWFENGNLISSSEDPNNLESGIYTLVVTDANGCEINSQEIQVGNIVGLSDPALEQFIMILPNPTDGKFQLQFTLENPANVQVEITDVLGRVLLSKVEGNIQESAIDFDLSAFASGVYPVKIYLDDKVVLKQVVLSR